MGIKLNRAPLYEQAYDELLRLIVVGTLQPGQRVTEKLLADLLGVSSTPVREAMRKLEQDGLIEGNGNSFQILALTPEDIEQLYICREALEVLAIGSAVGKLDERDLEDLEATLVAAEQAAQGGDFLKLVQINAAFHDKFLQAAGNRWLLMTATFIRRPLLLTRLRITFDERELPRILHDHRRILEALRRRDSAAAIEALREHMTADRERMRQELSSSQAQGKP